MISFAFTAQSCVGSQTHGFALSSADMRRKAAYIAS